VKGALFKKQEFFNDIKSRIDFKKGETLEIIDAEILD